MGLLNGVALVTGAGSGIGRAIALACAREGCSSILLADINTGGLEETKHLIHEQWSRAVTLVASVDVSNPDSVDDMVAKTLENFGRLDYAFNAAGISVTARVEAAKYPMIEYDQIQSINARGLMLCTQAETIAMLRQKPSVTVDGLDLRRAQRGSIVNIASTCSTSVIGRMLPYVTSKHAVLGITKAAALDHAADLVRINAVGPGLVETPMIEARRKQEKPVSSETATDWQQAPIYTTPIGRLALAEEVADTCIFLSSSMASHMTGALVAVDGGRSAAY